MNNTQTSAIKPVRQLDHAAADELPIRRGEQRLPALDGIRGVAVLAVLSYHYMAIGYPHFIAPIGFFLHNFGWAGVDLFFVLSGFLITGILLEAKGRPGYFKNFYMRRSLRIFPAYYVLLILMLIIVPAISPHLLDKPFLPTFGPHWVYYFYLSNYYFAYRGMSSGTLVHTWSLAIEEQFYLFWPALVLLCSRRRLFQIAAGMFCGALALRFIFLMLGANKDQIYFMSITRCDSLAIGAIVAILVRSTEGVAIIRQHSWWIAAVSILSLAALWALKRVMHATEFIPEEAIKYTCIALFCATFIGTSVVSSEKTLMNRVLSGQWLRFFGRYSYGLYLFHSPFSRIIDIYMGKAETTGRMLLEYFIFSVGTIVLALLSWHLIEKHMLKLKHFFPSPSAARDTLKVPQTNLPEPAQHDVLV
jgi:peptidoglycan/LPS O-acetylase OafA/YrhL